MGTVTALGDCDPNRYAWNPSNTATSGTWATHGIRSQIGFDSWETALAAAMNVAKTMHQVKVNKVGGEWVVSWQTPVAYNPTPAIPSHPYPTWTHLADGTNGATA